jgi:[ribosomal protein S18]-alanine N-acetyltransferase
MVLTSLFIPRICKEFTICNMNKAYTFRTALPRDLNDILKVEQTCFAADFCESASIFAERIKVFPEGFIIMEFEGNVMGFLCSEIWNYKENLSSKDFSLGHSIAQVHQASGNELYISSWGIAPDFRGEGLGKELFDKSLEIITQNYPKLKSTILIVSETWDKALNIYQHQGFTNIMILDEFFAYASIEMLNENGIVMRKKI